jgi:hypothetical protein
MALALMSGVSADLFTQDHDTQRELWNSFKKNFNKSYVDIQEEEYRFEIFLDTLKLIDERNKLEKGTAVHGITKFADLSMAEFRKFYLNYKPSQSAGLNKTKVILDEPAVVSSYSDDGYVSVDWTGAYIFI